MRSWLTTHRAVGQTVDVAARVAMVPMVVFVALRLFGRNDRSALLFAVTTLTPWLLLPAYVVAGLAVVTRARALIVASVAVVLLHIAWVAPDVRWWPIHQPEPTGTPFLVASANVAATNGRVDEVAAALDRLDADVLVVIELTPQLQVELDVTGVLDGYPHRVEDPSTGFFGAAIYSRYPVVDGSASEVDGFAMVRATIELPGASTTVVAVHTLQPLAGIDTLRRQLAVLDRVAHDVSGPIILAGDFNATTQHAPFRALLDDGIRDAHNVRGRAWVPTWPTGALIPSFARLDHILVSRQLVVLDAGEVSIPGSDHKAVTARLAHR